MSTTVYKAPTSITVTGGTAVTFSKGTPPTGSHYSEVNYGSASYREREKIIAYGKEPVAQNGNYSKALRRVTTQFPRDINEVYHLNSIKTEFNVQPEMSDADIDFMIDGHIQLMLSGKYRDFLKTGVVPTDA